MASALQKIAGLWALTNLFFLNGLSEGEVAETCPVSQPMPLASI